MLGTPEYTEALELWHQGQFWEVHEALEPLWLRLSGLEMHSNAQGKSPAEHTQAMETPRNERLERELTHGIILLAAALHKARTSPTGGWRNFKKALKHLEEIPEIYQGIRVAELVQETRRTLEMPSHRPGFPLL